jgi:hypothetical protein
MSNLPDKIDTQYQTNEGQWIAKLDVDLMEELIDNYNQLIDYLGEAEQGKQL